MNIDAGTAVPDRLAREISEVVTLGPAGTDAHNAARRFAKVRLVESFPVAMETALRDSLAALVPAGYIAHSGDTVTDSWVNLHFRYSGRMTLAGVWHEPTKPMCLATGHRSGSSPKELRTVALHPATAVFLEKHAPNSAPRFVQAKPLAVELARTGETDGCIGSVDLVRATGTLRILKTFDAVMVWCLYLRSEDS